MLFRKSVPNVQGEHLAWNLFISRAMGYRPAISVKKTSSLAFSRDVFKSFLNNASTVELNVLQIQ